MKAIRSYLMCGARILFMLAALSVTAVAQDKTGDMEKSPKEWAVLPCLPAETRALVRFKNLKSSAEALKETGLWKILNAPEFNEWSQPVMARLKQSLDGFAQVTGIDLKNAASTLQGELVLAFMGFLEIRNDKGEPIPDLLLALQPREQEERWMAVWGNLIDRLVEQTQQTLEIRRMEFAGADVFTVSHELSPLKLFYTLHEGTFLLSTGAGRIEGVLARKLAAQEGRHLGEETLVKRASFQRVMRQAGELADALFFIDFDGLRNMKALKLYPKSSKEERDWKNLGLHDLETLSFSAQLEDGFLRERIFVGMPATKRSGLLTLLDHAALNEDAFGDLAERSLGVLSLKLPLDLLLERLKTLAGPTDEGIVKLQAGLGELRKKLGIDLREDLFKTLTGSYTLHVSGSAQTGQLLAIPRVVLRIGISDQEKFKTVLNTLRQTSSAGLSFTESEVGTATIVTAKAKQPDAKGERGTFSYTIKGSEFLLSLYPLALREELTRTVTTQEYTDRETTYFATARAKLAPSQQLLMHLDLPRLTSAVFDVLIPLAQLSGKMPQGLDLDRFSTLRPLAMHVSPLLVALGSSEDGYTFESVSKVGGFTPLVLTLGVLGRKAHAQQRGAGLEERNKKVYEAIKEEKVLEADAAADGLSDF